MIRITEIKVAPNYKLICRFNSGDIKNLDVLPIIEQHKHLMGVEKLLNKNVFNNVRIGEFGEIVWNKIVTTEHKGQVVCWDYDISPEYAFQHATNC